MLHKWFWMYFRLCASVQFLGYCLWIRSWVNRTLQLVTTMQTAKLLGQCIECSFKFSLCVEFYATPQCTTMQLMCAVSELDWHQSVGSCCYFIRGIHGGNSVSDGSLYTALWMYVAFWDSLPFHWCGFMVVSCVFVAGAGHCCCYSILRFSACHVY